MTLTTTLQANGAADPPTGTVTFAVNGAVPAGCDSVQVTSLKASCTATSGTVQWPVNGTPAGAPVPVGADGTVPLGPLTSLAVGTDQITADYSGTDQFSPASGTDSIAVGKAATSISVRKSGQLLIASVTVVPPGAGQPTGTVTFTVNGKPAGTARLSAHGIAIVAIRPIRLAFITVSSSGDDTS